MFRKLILISMKVFKLSDFIIETTVVSKITDHVSPLNFLKYKSVTLKFSGKMTNVIVNSPFCSFSTYAINDSWRPDYSRAELLLRGKCIITHRQSHFQQGNSPN